MWVELVDVLMIDVGFTDVTWSHAWNSVCGGSNHHFLLAWGGPSQQREGMQRPLVLLAEVLSEYSAFALFANQTFGCSSTALAWHTQTGAKAQDLIYGLWPNRLCSLLLHPATPPPSLFALTTKSPFFFLLFLEVRLWLTILKFNSLRRAWKLFPLHPWKLPCLPTVVEGWKLNVMRFCLGETDWGGGKSQESDEHMQEGLGKERAELKDWNVSCLLLWLCGLRRAGLDKYTITLYHLSLQRCTRHPEFEGRQFLIGTWMIHQLWPT